MAIGSTIDLLHALQRYRLLEPAQLDELNRHLVHRFANPRALAGELIQRGWLTAYQVNQLIQGRGQELLLGSYVLLERLGEGGMGQVYKARHPKMGRIVALKVIRKDKLASPTAIGRFEREVFAAAQLSHPNVVTAFDADQAGDALFFVMEYVEGIDLARLIRESGPLPVEQSCAYIRQVALGLQHAHERGLVHRDIKPSNLMLLMKEGQVKILDMGVARLATAPSAETANSLTEDGAVVGTPDYAAPEQIRRPQDADIRADLYSLGCTFYFLLTGRPPFPGGALGEKLLKHQLDEAEPVEKLNPEVPRQVAGIVRRLMAKRPEDRFQTPGELADVLEDIVGSAPRTQVLARTSTVKFAVPQPLLRMKQPQRNRRLVLASGAIVLLLLGVGIGSYFLTRQRIHPVLKYELKKHPPEAVACNGHWFAFYSTKVGSWDEARARCQEMGGYLACIRSPEEEQCLLRLTNGRNAWLGGYNDSKKQWFWITGEPIEKFYWHPGQPNNGPNVYLQLIAKEWHDISRSEQKGYAAGVVCEWDY